ncbi:MAG: hypothetical protein K0R28_2343 [Paenibacillus sp.]|nr:hypothetical protein [Paenibacillus sp.]
MIWKSKGAAIGLIVAAGLAITAAVAVKPQNDRKFETLAAAASRAAGEKPDKSELLAQVQWYNSLRWRAADRPFRTDTEEPLLLYHSGDRKKGFLYIRNNEVVHQFADEAGFRSKTLLAFDRSAPAQLWRIGSSLLIGTQLPDRDHPVGEWYALHMPDDPHGEASTLRIERIHFGPDQVLTMTTVDTPRLYFVTVQNGSGFSEWMFKPGLDRFAPVSPKFASGGEPGAGQNYHLRKPERQAAQLSFKRQTQFPLPGSGTMSAFEDDRGTIVYDDAINVPHVSRYVDHRAVDFTRLTDDLGRSYPLGRFTDPQGRDVMSFPGAGYYSYFGYNPLLFEDGWRMYDLQNFYRIGKERIEIIQYEYERRSRFSHDRYWSYPLNGARLAYRTGDLLHFESAGKGVVLSTHDLILYRPQASASAYSLEELWITDVTWKWESAARADERLGSTSGNGHSAIAEPIKLQVPRSVIADVDRSAIPDDVLKAMEKDCFTGCGDYWSPPTIRDIDGQWVVLMQDTLYRLQDGALAELGRLPVKPADTVYFGKGGHTYTAQDFAKIGSHWFIADTFGSRIIKLDEQFQIVSEYPLPYPKSIEVRDTDRLRVVSMKGIAVLDADLRVQSESGQKFEFEETVELEWFASEDSSFADAKTGLTWFYFAGYVVQHDPKLRQYRLIYTGHNMNGAFQTKIIPVGEDIFLMMDERLVVFGRDGAWKRTIAYPRVPPIGDYSVPLSGEGSYRLDPLSKKLYLVQGYRIIAIDWTDGAVSELFRQNFSTAGNVVLRGSKLYFTLHNGDLYEWEKMRNELAVLDLAAGTLTRYKLDRGYVTSHMSDGAEPELVLRQWEPKYGHNGKPVYIMLPLHQLE